MSIRPIAGLCTCTADSAIYCDFCVAAREYQEQQDELERNAKATRATIEQDRDERAVERARDAFKRPILDAFDRLGGKK